MKAKKDTADRLAKAALKEFKSRTIAAGSNAKTIKGDDTFQTAIMYLAPHMASGMGNVCPMAEMAKCINPCLYGSGRAALFASIPKARVAKTQRYFQDRTAFMTELVRDIGNFVRHCAKAGTKPAVRLNGTSDIQWEIAHPCARNGVEFASIFEAFPDVVFYDYSKIAKRAYRALPSNYSLTLSWSGANPVFAAGIEKAARETGCNVAVVYRSKALRNSMIGRTDTFLPVVDGDETDMRFLDPKGVIVGLYAKGPAKKDASGFVVG